MLIKQPKNVPYFFKTHSQMNSHEKALKYFFSSIEKFIHPSVSLSYDGVKMDPKDHQICDSQTLTLKILLKCRFLGFRHRLYPTGPRNLHLTSIPGDPDGCSLRIILDLSKETPNGILTLASLPPLSWLCSPLSSPQVVFRKLKSNHMASLL